MLQSAHWLFAGVLAGATVVLPIHTNHIKLDQTKQGPPPPAAAPAGNSITVTVNYTGKGVVDASHEILLFLFNEPKVGPDSRPLGPPQIVTKNGAAATFANVSSTSPVYVLAIYDEAGTYDGRTGPPPVGTPIGFYAKDAKAPPTPVTPGPKTAIKLSFSGAQKFGK